MSAMRFSALCLLLVSVSVGCGSDSGGTVDARVGGGADAARTIDAAPAFDGAPFFDAASAADARVFDAPIGGGVDAAPAVDARPPVDAGPAVDSAAPVDAAPMVDAIPVMSLVEVLPSAAARSVSTNITVLGFNIASGATLKLSNCDTATVYDLSSGATVADNGRSISAMLAASPTREQGLYTVTVTNPDGMTDSLVCAFLISAAQPPTVTAVTPSSAFAGAATDGLLSDELVAISGTGFAATPSVRWTRVDGTGSYEAQVVSFLSSTQITAVVPTETLGMPVGDYKVTVQNPDLLTGTWSGVFTVTGNPPPRITDIDPVRVTNGAACTSTPVVVTGVNFDPDSAAGLFVAPASFGCAGGVLDANGNKLCPMATSARSTTSVTVRFTSCPGTGPWPLAVRNPDGQIGYWYSLEVTPSNEGHLNNDAFLPVLATLNLARWKHGAAYAFDAFGHAFLYVAGGQGTAKTVLGSVEVSQLSIFGQPGPFVEAQQYGGPGNPRIDNQLAVPREGHTLLRAGKTLFAIGGATSITDVPAIVNGTTSVERAYLLSYDEMPRARRPMEIGANGLPKGTWYYQVSAVGPWGESLGSLEVQLRTTAGGSIQVCWGAVSGATAYNIYRSLGSDGRAGTAVLLASEVSAPCFMDDGAGVLAPAPGRLRGRSDTGTMAAGTYSYRVSAVVGNNETHASYAASVTLSTAGAVVLNWDAVKGASGYWVYRLDGDVYHRIDDPATGTTFTDNNSDLSNTEPTPELRPLPPGSLSLWSEVPASQFLMVPRDGVDGVVIRLEPDNATDPIARIIVAGGRTSNENTAAYLKTAESIAVGPDGQLVGAWEPEAAEFDTQRAFYALITTQDRNVTPFPPPPIEPPCPDADGDGYIACTCAPAGVVCDCDDTNPDINPGEDEICGDGIDQNCDGMDDMCICTTDADNDGWVSDAMCDGGDCCDSGTEGGLGCSLATAGQINPDVIEICGDGIDQDCDGVDPSCECTIDADNDGHMAFACLGDDCCDSGAENSLGCTAATAQGIHPGAIEICGDAIDQDCDGVDPGCVCEVPDADHDGHDSLACGGDDCCDEGTENAVGCSPGTAADMYPGNVEICGDGIDQNCSGSDLICKQPGTIAKAPQVAGDEPVFVLAMLGVSGISRNGTTSTSVPNDLVLKTLEACPVNMETGRLNCGTKWIKQNNDVGPARESFGLDGLAYFDFVYPFTGANAESTSNQPSTRVLPSTAITRFVLNSPTTTMDGQIVGTNQGGSTKFTTQRSHYQILRLMSYIYVIAGWTDGGPTDTVESHLQ